MEDIDHPGAAHSRRIVDSRFVESKVIAKLLGAAFGDADHVIFGAKMQASGRTGLDARGLQPFTHAIGAQRALEHLLSGGIEFRNIERTSADAVAAADAVLLLEVHDAV